MPWKSLKLLTWVNSCVDGSPGCALYGCEVTRSCVEAPSPPKQNTDHRALPPSSVVRIPKGCSDRHRWSDKKLPPSKHQAQPQGRSMEGVVMMLQYAVFLLSFLQLLPSSPSMIHRVYNSSRYGSISNSLVRSRPTSEHTPLSYTSSPPPHAELA